MLLYYSASLFISNGGLAPAHHLFLWADVVVKAVRRRRLMDHGHRLVLTRT